MEPSRVWPGILSHSRAAAHGVDVSGGADPRGGSERVLASRCTRSRTSNQVFVVGWTGMRGVVALAAANSLPFTLNDGSPFPQRSFIIFLTFSLILVTLVLQGLSLPWLVRKLGALRT